MTKNYERLRLVKHCSNYNVTWTNLNDNISGTIHHIITLSLS